MVGQMPLAGVGADDDAESSFLVSVSPIPWVSPFRGSGAENFL